MGQPGLLAHPQDSGSPCASRDGTQARVAHSTTVQNRDEGIIVSLGFTGAGNERGSRKPMSP